MIDVYRVRAQVATTFWSHVDPEEVELDVPDIEALFKKKEIKKVVKEEKEEKARMLQSRRKAI